MSRIVTIDLDSLDPDDQRSFSMLRRTKGWGKAVKDSKSRVSETVTPVAPTKPKLSVVRDDAPSELESRIAALMAELLGDDEPESKPTKTKGKTKTKGNDFYERVIKGGYKKRAEAKPYKCEEPDCYKYGRRFSKAGWFGSDTGKGHIQLSSAHK